MFFHPPSLSYFLLLSRHLLLLLSLKAPSLTPALSLPRPPIICLSLCLSILCLYFPLLLIHFLSPFECLLKSLCFSNLCVCVNVSLSLTHTYTHTLLASGPSLAPSCCVKARPHVWAAAPQQAGSRHVFRACQGTKEAIRSPTVKRRRGKEPGPVEGAALDLEGKV